MHDDYDGMESVLVHLPRQEIKRLSLKYGGGAHHVTGYPSFTERRLVGSLQGDTGGEADKIKEQINEGDFVLNSTDISLLGDGNTANGFKKWNEFESKIPLKYGGSPTRRLDVELSDGEHVVPNHVVTYLGKGDNGRGAKLMERMRVNLRKHKRVKDILPPKTRSIGHYLR